MSCQVGHASDSSFELYPSGSNPADCGTFVVVNDVLYSPNVSGAASALGVRTAWTPVSQSVVSGSGTAASPFKTTTVAAAGTSGLRATNVDIYITGQESYRTDVTLQNTSGATLTGVIYRAGDCYLQSSDTGFGFVDASIGAVGCSLNPNNSPVSRIEQWYPITPGNQYMEASFSEVWSFIATHAPFPNTTRANDRVDNGAGISWRYSLAAGASATFSHYTTFSPTGVTGPPPPPASTTPSGVFGPNGLLTSPSNKRCVSRRYFPIKVRKRFWPVIVGVTVKMPKTTRVLRRKPWGIIVDLRGLTKGRFNVKITALTTSGKTLKSTRRYYTCKGKLKGSKPKL